MLYLMHPYTDGCIRELIGADASAASFTNVAPSLSLLIASVVNVRCEKDFTHQWILIAVSLTLTYSAQAIDVSLLQSQRSLTIDACLCDVCLQPVAFF